jgi:hypothetical protein
MMKTRVSDQGLTIHGHLVFSSSEVVFQLSHVSPSSPNGWNHRIVVSLQLSSRWKAVQFRRAPACGRHFYSTNAHASITAHAQKLQNQLSHFSTLSDDNR